jgi:hypothetical protein
MGPERRKQRGMVGVRRVRAARAARAAVPEYCQPLRDQQSWAPYMPPHLPQCTEPKRFAEPSVLPSTAQHTRHVDGPLQKDMPSRSAMTAPWSRTSIANKARPPPPLPVKSLLLSLLLLLAKAQQTSDGRASVPCMQRVNSKNDMNEWMGEGQEEKFPPTQHHVAPQPVAWGSTLS